MQKIDLKQFQGFDWDRGNQNKNWEKHEVLHTECEQVFFNKPILLGDDKKHSSEEVRYFALGRTSQNRKLFIVFTARDKLIRVISAREMNRKEREFYEKIEIDSKI